MAKWIDYNRINAGINMSYIYKTTEQYRFMILYLTKHSESNPKFGFDILRIYSCFMILETMPL